MWLIVLSDQLRIVALVGRYPNQLANPARAHPRAEAEATIWRLHLCGDASCGISPGFPGLSRSLGQVAHVLLTRSPLYLPRRAFSFDLHVLSTPPAFVLSQDQTLHDKCRSRRPSEDALRETWKSPAITRMTGSWSRDPHRHHAERTG